MTRVLSEEGLANRKRDVQELLDAGASGAALARKLLKDLELERAARLELKKESDEIDRKLTRSLAREAARAGKRGPRGDIFGKLGL